MEEGGSPYCGALIGGEPLHAGSGAGWSRNYEQLTQR